VAAEPTKMVRASRLFESYICRHLVEQPLACANAAGADLAGVRPGPAV